jgi:hypothetical protein
MPASSTQEAIQGQLVKWGFVAIIGLVGAGLLSLANRNVYSKEQVDSKFEYHNEVQRLQNQRVLDKLEVITDDVAEIKEQVKDDI